DLVSIDFTAAAYNLLQVVRCYHTFRRHGKLMKSLKNMAWVCYLLDQVLLYMLIMLQILSFKIVFGQRNNFIPQ
ncbi:unnamed protein product, partial [Ilex paraguariensis]